MDNDTKDNKCKECGLRFEDLRSLHRHFGRHRMLVVDYYHKYFPRRDLLTGELIKYKARDQYFTDDFTTRTNLKKWLEQQPLDDARGYCKGLLAKRKTEKDIKYTPCQVELKSLLVPAIPYYNNLFGDYYALCKELGFENKYSFLSSIPENLSMEGAGYEILVDTREQRPLTFKDTKTTLCKLDYGDYRFIDDKKTCNCVIERKSLSDFINTISSYYDRFMSEIELSIKEESNLIILVEEKIQNAFGFKYLPYISKKIKATPEFVFYRVRVLIQKYPQIQFLFVDGRQEASRVVKKIFASDCAYKQIDLQLAYENKIL